MSEYFTHKVDGKAALELHTWQDIQDEAGKNNRSRILVESYSEAKQMSKRQIKWWKGVLLPALSKDTGDSVAWWENHLKLEILPDVFQPVECMVDGYFFRYLPSITTLSMTKANILVEGSVDYLRNEKGFMWVQLPDPLKREK